MAAVSKFGLSDMTVTANFRNYVNTISAQLAAFGWVKTADTGQIDPATVVAPSVANTYAGYEMWAMGDTLQATAPVFLKIRYGRSASNTPMLAASVGTLTDGAGVFTGVSVSVEKTSSAPADASGLNRQSYVSGANNRMAAFLYETGWNTQISVERTKNADGTDSAEGAIFVFQDGAAQGTLQVVFCAQTAPYAGVGMSFTGANGQSTFAGTTVLAPLYPGPGRIMYPGMNHLLVGNNDGWPVRATVVVTMYGAAHSFIISAQTNMSTVTASAKTAMRWE